MLLLIERATAFPKVFLLFLVFFQKFKIFSVTIFIKKEDIN